MARGNDPGRDFDNQWNESRRRGVARAAAGEGPWRDDKYLERENTRLSGPAARHAKKKDESCGKAVAFIGGFLLVAALIQPEPARAAVAEDACGSTSNSSPAGDCGPFKLLYRETFGAEQVPVGAFSECAGDGDHRCEGLRDSRYYDDLGAYPDGWPDTAASGADGNNGPVPGYYRPQWTVSVRKASNGDGQLRVKMYRPAAGGSNRVAAVVPRKCMNLRYGKFTERFVVRTTTPGFKLAHLRYTPDEVDYPEAGQTFGGDPVSVFTHGFKDSAKDVAPNSAWTSWHTYSTEIVPGQLRFYLDGDLVQTVNADFPEAADWILQNESALGRVPGAAPGSSVIIDTTWLNCYKYQP